MKRSQITMFVLIGAAVLVFFGIILMRSGTIQNSYNEAVGDGSRVAYTKSSLHSYVQDCLKDIALEAVDEKGILDNEGIAVYIDNNIADCIDLDSLKENGIEVDLSGAKSSVSLGTTQKAMVVDAVIPIVLPMENGERSEMDEFHYSMDIVKEVEFEIDGNGALIYEVRQMSGDMDLELILPKGVIAYDEDGNPVDEVEIKVIPNDDDGIVGQVQYELNPPLVFSRPVELVFDYDGEDVADESQLNVVFLSNGIWRAVDTRIDTELKQVTGEITHFSTYALHGSCGSDETVVYYDTENIALGSFSTEEGIAFNLNHLDLELHGLEKERVCLRTFTIEETFSYPIVSMTVYDFDTGGWKNVDIRKWMPGVEFGECVADDTIGGYIDEFEEKLNENFYDNEAILVNDGSNYPLFKDGLNRFSFGTMYEVPEKIYAKTFKEGTFMSCDSYCAEADSPTLCLEECEPAEFDWNTRFLIKLNGNFNKDLRCVDAGCCVEFSKGKVLTEGKPDMDYLKNEFFAFRTWSESPGPFIPPMIIDGNIVWRANTCLESCGNGQIDAGETCDIISDTDVLYSGITSQDEAICYDDYHIAVCNDYCNGYDKSDLCWSDYPYECFADEGCHNKMEGDRCKEDDMIGICDNQCRCVENPVCGNGILEYGEVCDNNLEGYEYGSKFSCNIYGNKLVCNEWCTGYDVSDYCVYKEECNYAGSSDCSNQVIGEDINLPGGIVGKCNSFCEFVLNTCGNGVLDPEEVCDVALTGRDGSGIYCSDMMHRSFCKEDCSGYEETGVCEKSAAYCSAGTNACVGKKEGDPCDNMHDGYWGVCDDKCQCTDTCGNGVLDDGEICDASLDQKWGEHNGQWCFDEMHWSYCKNDCTGFIDTGICFCEKSDPACVDHKDGDEVIVDGKKGFCNENCEFVEYTCGNGVREEEKGERCDSAPNPPWGDGQLHVCGEYGHLYKCRDDCSDYDYAGVCWYDETDGRCTGGSPECHNIPMNGNCITADGHTGICNKYCVCKETQTCWVDAFYPENHEVFKYGYSVLIGWQIDDFSGSRGNYYSEIYVYDDTSGEEVFTDTVTNLDSSSWYVRFNTGRLRFPYGVDKRKYVIRIYVKSKEDDRILCKNTPTVFYVEEI